MNIQVTKMELIEMLISTKEVMLLKEVRDILENKQEQLTAEDYKIINFRRNKHLKGESQSFSWTEAKQKVLIGD